MSKITVQQILNVSETMLIPLWARAVETQQAKPIIRDLKASEIMARLDYDFSKFEKAWMSQVGIAVRTMLLDRATCNFLQHHPGAVVINLGAGLDTRFERLHDDRIRIWYDVDVPDIIHLRRQFFSENECCRFIARSMFDLTWMEEIADQGRSVLIIAEGVLMYFTEDELKPFFDQLIVRFPEAEMLFEMLSPLFVGKSKHHDAVNKIDGQAEFKWGLKTSQTIATWNPRISYLEEWNYFDFHKDRWKFLRWLALIPAFKSNFNNRIVHLRFE